MVGRSDHFHGQGVYLVTTDDAYPAPPAFLRIDRGFHLLGFFTIRRIRFNHLNRVEHAAFHAVLASDALVLVDNGHIAAFRPDSLHGFPNKVHGNVVHAAVPAALATGGDPLHNAGVGPHMKEPFLLYFIT